MTQQSNISVKKADGTTDQVWTAVQPSAGLKSPAVWENKDVGSTRATRPSFALKASDNGPGTARRLDGSVLWPVSGTDAYGRAVVVDRIPIQFTATVPNNVPLNVSEEAVAQSFNLFASALVVECVTEGNSAS